MTAADYWRQFVHTISFATPTTVAGVLTARSQDGPKDDPYPVLVLTLDSGYRARVNVTQTRLLAELIRTRPNVGDRLEIVYHGDSDRAAPGRSPLKDFQVAVTRGQTGSQPRARTESEASGEVGSENGPGTGGN